MVMEKMTHARLIFKIRVAHTDGLESLSHRDDSSKDIRFFLHYEIRIYGVKEIKGAIEILPPFDCVQKDEDECYWVRINGKERWDGDVPDGIYRYDGRFYVRRLISNKEKIVSEIILPYQEVVVDRVSPNLEIVSPVDGKVYTEIPFFRIIYSDNLSGIEKVFIILDGEDIKNRFDFADGEAEYYPDILPYGTHRFDVSVVDRAQNVNTISINFSFVSKEKEEEFVYVLSFLEELKPVYGFEEGLKDLKLVDYEEFEGVARYAFQQTYKGIPVYGYTLDVGVAVDGYPSSVFGDYYPHLPEIDITPRIGFEDAVDIALDDIGKREDEIDVIPFFGMEPYQKIIYIKDNTPHLAWKIYIQYKDEGGAQYSYESIVDAKTGEVLDRIPLFRREEGRIICQIVYNKPACVRCFRKECYKKEETQDVVLKGVNECVYPLKEEVWYRMDAFDVVIRDNKEGDEWIKVKNKTEPLCFDHAAGGEISQYADMVNGWYWLRLAQDYIQAGVEKNFRPDHPVKYDVNVELGGNISGTKSYDFHWCCYWVPLVQFDKGLPGYPQTDYSRNIGTAFHEYGHVYHNEVAWLYSGAYAESFCEAVAEFFKGAMANWIDALDKVGMYTDFPDWPTLESHLRGKMWKHYAWAYNKITYDNDTYIYYRTRWWADHFWRVKTLIGEKMDSMMHSLLHKVGSRYASYGEAFDALLSVNDEMYKKTHWYEIYLSQIIAGLRGNKKINKGHLPYTYTKSIKYDDFKENGVDFYYASRIGRRVKIALSPSSECLKDENTLSSCINDKRAFLSNEFELTIINPFHGEILKTEPPVEKFCTEMEYGWICDHLGFDKVNIKGKDMPDDVLDVWEDYVSSGELILYYAGYAYDYDDKKWTISTLNIKPPPIKSFVVTDIPTPEKPRCVMGKGYSKDILFGIFLIFLCLCLIRVLKR